MYRVEGASEDAPGLSFTGDRSIRSGILCHHVKLDGRSS